MEGAKYCYKTLSLNTLLGLGVFISLYKLGPHLHFSHADIIYCFISTRQALLQLEALGSLEVQHSRFLEPEAW